MKYLNYCLILDKMLLMWYNKTTDKVKGLKIMTKEEFITKCQEILTNSGDMGKISSTLDELRDGFNESVTQSEILTKANAELTEKNANLQQANMNLFLKCGVENVEKSAENEEKADFAKLFNEKGELI